MLLPPASDFVPKRLDEIAAALAPALARLKTIFADHSEIHIYNHDPATWSVIFRVLQGDEIRRRHGDWIDTHDPNFGPGIAERSVCHACERQRYLRQPGDAGDAQQTESPGAKCF